MKGHFLFFIILAVFNGSSMARNSNPCAGLWWGNIVANPSNCAGYYKCVLTIPFGRSCGRGLVFDSSEKKCVEGNQNTCEIFGPPPTEPPTEAPETEAPEPEAPETEAPETEEPETEEPETEAPETEEPETEAPETVAPETEEPETEAPETEEPETETKAPAETEVPETDAPETEAPAETQAPE